MLEQKLIVDFLLNACTSPRPKGQCYVGGSCFILLWHFIQWGNGRI